MNFKNLLGNMLVVLFFFILGCKKGDLQTTHEELKTTELQPIGQDTFFIYRLVSHLPKFNNITASNHPARWAPLLN